MAISMIGQETFCTYSVHPCAGEAATDSLNMAFGQACSFVSAIKELLRRFVANHFPTARNVKVVDAAALEATTAGSSAMLNAAPGSAAAAPAAPQAGQGRVQEKRVEIEECMQARASLLAAIDAIELPAHFLDGALLRVSSTAMCLVRST